MFEKSQDRKSSMSFSGQKDLGHIDEISVKFRWTLSAFTSLSVTAALYQM